MFKLNFLKIYVDFVFQYLLNLTLSQQLRFS